MGAELGSPFLSDAIAAFAGRWVCAGLACDLPGPESRFVHETPGRSVLLCRSAEGELAAFVNACTHRGTRLCTGRGQGRIQCPYHGWVFGCDGRLLGATRRAGLPAFDDADYALRPLAVAQAGPLLFVHDDPRAELALEPSLTELLERCQPTPVRRTRRSLPQPREALLTLPPPPPGPLLRWGLGGEGSSAWTVGPNLRVDRYGRGVRLRLLTPTAPGATSVEEVLLSTAPVGALSGFLCRFG